MKHRTLILFGLGLTVASVCFLKSIGWFEYDKHLYDKLEGK